MALIPGIKSSQVIEALRKEISYEVRLQVKEVTLDMSPTMDCIVSELFPQAKRTLDRFHVTKNVLEDIQAVRMRIKTQIKDEELQKEDQCKIDRVKYIAKKLSNHETRLDCITRIRYQLFKRRKDWNTCQKKRWETIRQYREFDEICISYEMVEIFYSIYDTQMTPETAKPLWIHWLTHISQYGYIRELQNTGRMIQNHLAGILNYFHHRSSNAFAE